MKRLIILIISLTITARAQLFSDNFTRGSDPGPLGAWTNAIENWTVTGGTMQGGPNVLLNRYGFLNTTNTYSNFTVQARVKLPAGAFGGGLGGRYNPNGGAHYGL